MRSAPRRRWVFFLLEGDQRPNWNFGEEFPRRFPRQTNAAVRRGIIGHYPFVHSEIETAQSHKIGHIDVIDSRAMIALFVSDHEIAAFGAVTFASGGTDRI